MNINITYEFSMLGTWKPWLPISPWRGFQSTVHTHTCKPTSAIQSHTEGYRIPHFRFSETNKVTINLENSTKLADVPGIRNS
ncbi:hypothetical protein CI610_03240 [invertebrate metagenome]|uniref:Uncharacterized protein n=1 Tax=invertebrate metagenome TaxID=1711999 RepID=A0A2H9T3N6_9ZZZZ